MQLTFLQKQRMIDHLSRPENWRNKFSMDFFMADDRKGHSRSLNEATTRFVNDKGNKIQLSHKSGAKVFFEVREGDVVVTDETSNTLIVTPAGVESNWARVSPAQPRFPSKEMIEVPGTSLWLHFDEQGNKTLFAGRQQVEMPGPASKPFAPLQKGAQIHVVKVSDANADAWGLPVYDLLAATQLVVSCDLGIDPGIKAVNTLEALAIVPEADQPDEQVVRQLFPKKVRNLVGIQKLWKDTTEFTGYDIPLPNTFHIEKDDDGLNVITSLDQREAIWSQGDIFRYVLKSGTTPVQTVTSRTTPRHFVNMLSHGESVRDGRGREWSYVLVKTKDSLAVSLNVRAAVRNEFGLSARHCAVITYDDSICVVAMNARVLEAAAKKSDTFREAELDKIVQAHLAPKQPPIISGP